MQKVRLLRFIQQLRRLGPVDPIAIAFIATEMRFRGPFLRLGEALHALWSIYVLRREPKLTLGKCQVSFSYWRRRFGERNIDLLIATFDDVISYEVCCSYLKANSRTTLEQTIIQYNGRPSVLYVKLFYKNLALVASLSAQASVKLVVAERV